MAQPNPEGKAMPAIPTLNATVQLLAKYCKSTFSPMRKRTESTSYSHLMSEMLSFTCTDETNGCNEIQIGHCSGWEESLRETGYASHGGWTQQYAADDFRDDPRLAKARERMV